MKDGKKDREGGKEGRRKERGKKKRKKEGSELWGLSSIRIVPWRVIKLFV